MPGCRSELIRVCRAPGYGVELASSMAMARAVGCLYTKVAGRDSPV